MALGIAHRDGGRAVLDLLREVEPPFSPGRVIVEQFVPVVKAYGCREVRGDRHAVGFVAEYFAGGGITFVPSVHSKAELYAELLPMVNTGLVELLDHPTLRNQLLALERRSVRGGRDSIDHPRGGHDDVANVAAGALVSVTGVGEQRKPRVLFSGSGAPSEPRSDGGRAMLAVVATRTIARLAVEDEIDRAREARDEDAPMLAEPIWFGRDAE